MAGYSLDSRVLNGQLGQSSERHAAHFLDHVCGAEPLDGQTAHLIRCVFGPHLRANDVFL